MESERPFEREQGRLIKLFTDAVEQTNTMHKGRKCKGRRMLEYKDDRVLDNKNWAVWQGKGVMAQCQRFPRYIHVYLYLSPFSSLKILLRSKFQAQFLVTLNSSALITVINTH